MNLICGDCIEVMAGMEPESVDAIVTDPPYGLEFMGKEWDRLQSSGRAWRRRVKESSDDPEKDWGVFNRTSARAPHSFVAGHEGQAWHQAWAEATYRVAKPSAYLLAFGGTRTVHRMTCALEDAGWIIRDMLVWGYASGFPKSKASLKPAWEPIVMARKPGPLRMLAIDECRLPTSDNLNGGEFSSGGRTADLPGAERSDSAAGMLAAGGGRKPGEFVQPAGRWPANIVLTDPIFDGGIEGVVGGGETSTHPGTMRNDATPSGFLGDTVRLSGSVLSNGDTGTYSRFFLIPKSDREDREPVLEEYAYRLHRERGECVPTSRRRATAEASTEADNGWNTMSSGSESVDPSPMASRSTTSTATSRTTGSTTSSPLTPLPTSDSIPAANSETVNGGSLAESVAHESLWELPTGISVPRAGRYTDDADPATSGSWSRKSNCARCGKRLPRFSTHPTQKPTELMRHLIRLVTPPGGVILDPFLGSGTTAKAAELEGVRWIGIEREAEYVAIAKARLNGTQRGLGLGA